MLVRLSGTLLIGGALFWEPHDHRPAADSRYLSFLCVIAQDEHQLVAAFGRNHRQLGWALVWCEILCHDLDDFATLDLNLGDELIDDEGDFVAVLEENVRALAYDLDCNVLAVKHIEVGARVHLRISFEPQGLCLGIVLDGPSVDVFHLDGLLDFFRRGSRSWLRLGGRCFLFLLDLWCRRRGRRRWGSLFALGFVECLGSFSIFGASPVADSLSSREHKVFQHGSEIGVAVGPVDVLLFSFLEDLVGVEEDLSVVLLQGLLAFAAASGLVPEHDVHAIENALDVVGRCLEVSVFDQLQVLREWDIRCLQESHILWLSELGHCSEKRPL